MAFKCAFTLGILGICTFVAGYGTGGIKRRIGTTTTADRCARLVRIKDPSANGASWANKNCFAEFGATGNDGNSAYRTCQFNGEYL